MADIFHIFQARYGQVENFQPYWFLFAIIIYTKKYL